MFRQTMHKVLFQFQNGTIRSENQSIEQIVAEWISIPKWYDQKQTVLNNAMPYQFISIPKWYDQKDSCKSRYEKRCFKFQFQNGTIRRQKEKHCSHYQDYFNSKMVRLEENVLNLNVIEETNFNSKMVRLEVFSLVAE